MIRDEDVIKTGTSAYMKPHERLIYVLGVIFGILLAIAGIIMLAVGLNNENDHLFVWGIVLIAVGIFEIVGVALLLWTEGVKRTKRTYKNEIDYN